MDDGDEGVVGQFGHEEGDEVGFSSAQRARRCVGDVVEVAGCLSDALDGCRSDLDITASTVEDQRHG